MNWFSVSTNVLDRLDLNVYEKMCYVFLAQHIQNGENELSMEDLASKMSVELIVAKGAFHALRTKGIIQSDSHIQAGMIIKAKDTNVESQDYKKANLSYGDKVDQVFDIIEEKINEKEAKIILNFANNDIQKIKDKYKIAQASQYQDKIEVLIHELQKKATGRIIKKESVEKKTEVFDSFDEKAPVQKTQVNTYKLNQMKKYKNK